MEKFDVVFLPSAFSEPFELVLGYIKRQVESGQPVIAVRCGQSPYGCTSNPLGLRLICKGCVSCSDELLHVHDVHPRLIKTLELSSAEAYSHEDLRHATSTILTSYRRKIDDRLLINRVLLKGILKTWALHSSALHDAMRDFLQGLHISRLSVFNGRIIPYHMLVRYAKSNSLEFRVIEKWGSHPGETTYFDNITLPLFSDLSNYFNECFKRVTDDQRVRYRRTLDKLTSSGKDLTPFVASPQQKVISLFTSSLDEMSIDPSFMNKSTDVTDVIKSLVKHFEKRSVLVVVREHPNGAGDRTLEGREMRRELEMMSHKCDDLNFYSASSQVNSYALIESSDVVVTFGSSIGWEVAFMKVPSVLYGAAFWQQQEVQIKANSLKELIQHCEYYLYNHQQQSTNDLIRVENSIKCLAALNTPLKKLDGVSHSNCQNLGYGYSIDGLNTLEYKRQYFTFRLSSIVLKLISSICKLRIF